MSDSGGLFFVDGPGGTGKSFLYKVLLAHIHSKGFIAIIVTSSGIDASTFLGGQTTHSIFKIPISGGPGMKCQISFQSLEVDLIRAANIIIWDEAQMADIETINTLNKLLQDLCESDCLFAGNLVVFGGDFRQVLPVFKGANRIEQIRASFFSSKMWKEFNKMKLTHNMRERDDPTFTEFLMRVGNGDEPKNSRGEIQIANSVLIPYTTIDESTEALTTYVYLNMSQFETAPFEMTKRAILSPKNEFVDDINSRLIQRIAGEEVVYVSDDQAKNATNQGNYVDYLNSLEPKGLPQHKLTLKKNYPIILLRNINHVEGICNGTRLICKQLLPNVVGAIIATWKFRGKVWIPRIPLEPNPFDNKYLIHFVRRHISLRLCFAMTINKAEGQTLDCVGLYLRQPVFCHLQLYVGLSRVKTGSKIKVVIIPPTLLDPSTKYTTNVVYNEVLVKANIA